MYRIGLYMAKPSLFSPCVQFEFIGPFIHSAPYLWFSLFRESDKARLSI